jgi:hypothetical protein
MQIHIDRVKDSVSIKVDDKEIFLDWETALEVSKTIEDIAYDIDGIVADYSSLPGSIYNGTDYPLLQEYNK